MSKIEQNVPSGATRLRTAMQALALPGDAALWQRDLLIGAVVQFAALNGDRELEAAAEVEQAVIRQAIKGAMARDVEAARIASEPIGSEQTLGEVMVADVTESLAPLFHAGPSDLGNRT